MKYRNSDLEMLSRKDVQLAYQIGDMYFAIQTSDEGYDYTFFDEDYLDEDGGIYDDPTVSISEAVKVIFAEEGYSLDDAKEIDYNELMASVEEVEDQQMRKIETKDWLQKKQMEKKNNMTITLGWVISARRHDLGYTQHEMARAVGISDFTVSRIESDDGITPDNNTLRKIAEYLKIDHNSLLTLKPVGVIPEMRLNQREIKNINADQKENTMTILQSAFSDAFASDGGGKDCYISDEQTDLERRLVLFVMDEKTQS